MLWDVDGTLVACGDIGAAVFDLAIEHVLGCRPPTRIQMSGKTDPQIVAEYLALLDSATEPGPGGPAAGPGASVDPRSPGGRTATVPDPDGPWAPDERTAAVLARLQVELAAAAHQVRRGHTMPGVPALLARLHDDPAFEQTVLTGNIAPNAAVKLGAFDLLRWLDLGLGAFGSDHVDRTRLVPIALRRVAARFGGHPPPDRVWVVGDAPNDLAAARAGGVNCLLVGTGRYPASALAELGPDAVLPDLADTDAVMAVLRSDPGPRR